MKVNELTREIIAAAIEVHRHLGPEKPEAAYEGALARELTVRGIVHQAQKPVPVVYKGIKLDCGYRLDGLVAGCVVIEAKAVEVLIPVHRAQVLTYLKLGGWNVALLLNFNVALLKQGIERLVLGLREGGEQAAAAPIHRQKRASSTSIAPGFLSQTPSGDPAAEELTREVIASAIEVHRVLGPGLLPSAYEACLCHELHLRRIAYELGRPLPINYKGLRLGATDEVELLVGGRVVVNARALSAVEPVHELALLSQLRLGGWRLGLLINFNELTLAAGLRRIVLSR